MCGSFTARSRTSSSWSSRAHEHEMNLQINWVIVADSQRVRSIHNKIQPCVHSTYYSLGWNTIQRQKRRLMPLETLYHRTFNQWMPIWRMHTPFWVLRGREVNLVSRLAEGDQLPLAPPREFAAAFEKSADWKSFPASVWQVVITSQAVWSSATVMPRGSIHLQMKSASHNHSRFLRVRWYIFPRHIWDIYVCSILFSQWLV